MTEDISFGFNQPLANDDLNSLFASTWGYSSLQPRRYDFQPMLERSMAYACAHSSGRLVGFVNLAWDGGVHTFISAAVVHPDFQKRGIGSQLVRQVVDVARKRGRMGSHRLQAALAAVL